MVDPQLNQTSRKEGASPVVVPVLPPTSLPSPSPLIDAAFSSAERELRTPGNLGVEKAHDSSRTTGETIKSEGLLREIGRSYRAEAPSIPASALSSFISGSCVFGILSIEPVKLLVQSFGTAGSAFASLAMNFTIWYGIFNYAIDPLAKRIFNRPVPKRDEFSDGERKAEKLFLGYSIAFNLVQYAAQMGMLHAGLAPRDASAWNSLVGNIVWLSTIPLVKYACAHFGEKWASGNNENQA